MVNWHPKTLAFVLLAVIAHGDLRAQDDRPWVVIDTFRYDFGLMHPGELLFSTYLLHKVAVRQPHGTYDTLDFALATTPGWYSDSSLLLVAMFHRVPLDPLRDAEVVRYYEYLLPSASFRRARLPPGFWTRDISPDGHCAAKTKGDSTGIFAQLWGLPSFRVVARGEYLCRGGHALVWFEWTPEALIWERAGCGGVIRFP